MTIRELKAAIADMPDDLPVKMVMEQEENIYYSVDANKALPVHHKGKYGPLIAFNLYSYFYSEKIPITVILNIEHGIKETRD